MKYFELYTLNYSLISKKFKYILNIKNLVTKVINKRIELHLPFFSVINLNINNEKINKSPTFDNINLLPLKINLSLIHI